MGRIKEIIKSFINPAPEEKTFKELALASGLNPEEVEELNQSKGGINWFKFAGEEENPKNNKKERKQKQIWKLVEIKRLRIK